MSNTSQHTILHQIREKEPLDKVVNYYLESIEKDGLDNYMYTLSDIIQYIKTSFHKRVECKSYCDDFYEKLSPFFSDLDNKDYKTIFKYFLDESCLSEKWNILNILNEEQKHFIIFDLVKESKIIDKFNKKNIDLSLYLNPDRIYGIEVNLKERCLINLLYAHYPERKSRLALFNHVCEKFTDLIIDNNIIKQNLKIENIFSQNFLNLSQELKNQLNENIYDQKIHQVTHQLNTESCILYNVLNIASKSFLQYGYFYSPHGTKLSTSKEFSDVYLNNPSLNNLMQDFLLLKLSKAQIPNSKKFWLDLSIELKNKKKAPEIRKPRMKI